VLGTRAEVRHAATLAELDIAAAEAAADELADLGLLKRARPLEFEHPVVRSVIYEDIAPGARSTSHWRAAKVIGEEEAAASSVAVHLLAAEPAGDTWAVDELRRAAADEPSPETAATYLQRALREPPPAELRGVLLLELGEAEARALAPLDEVIAHLRDAHAAAADPFARARGALALSGAFADAGQHAESRQVIADAVREIQALDPAPHSDERELLLRAEAMLLVADDLDGRTPSNEQFDHLRALAGAGESGGEKALLANLAFDALVAGRAMAEAIELARRALAGNTLLADQLYLDHHVATWALEFADKLDEAATHADAAVAATRARGSAAEVTFALTVRAAVANRRGALQDAEADARSALEIAAQEGLDPSLMQMTYAALVDTLVLRGEFEAAHAFARECDEYAPDTESPVRAFFLHSRGRLHAAEGRAGDACEDFAAAGRIMAARNQDHPAYYPWRSSAARQLRLLDRTAEAREHVEEELELARVWGAPRSLGVALRTAGLLAEDGLPLLAESVSVLERSPALLERAESLVELGAALRRRKQRVASKQPLLAALDIAHRCGARPLEERAREELAATGARPRRAVLTGVASLTASERRVAGLAAEGHANKEIAQTLFVSLATVEKHLGATYRKLDISSRRELPEALAEKSKVEP
jgi:ATP/maltotriose-dependent transcriptional regulator MalT